MAVTALYRVSSGECVKVSLTGQAFDSRDPTYWGVLTDPVRPDGDAVREALPDGTLGPFRVLGFSKLAIPGSNTVRNATAPEIATFAAAEATDEAAQDVTSAADLIDMHPRWRKIFKALLKRVIAENNLQAAQWNAFRAQVAAASNLAALKSGVANNTTDMPTRTLSQAVSALLADLDPND